MLAAECDDGTLRAEVESLLAAHESGGPIEPEGDASGSLLTRLLTPLESGDRVGNWRIVRRIGAGGMGIVFLAQRDDPSLEQQVALKIVRTIGSSEDVLRRFLAERQIVARLDHPGIARLFDAGVTDDGDPWYAMEYVDGTPIDRYCDRNRLDLEGRLELVLAVCEAVSHAHRNLIIHRDLKPANILVSEDGRPRLLDFGIARMLEEGATAEQATAITRTTRRWFTPECASPEQVAGRPVTTASDVYSLGVLLYRLLAGHPPYQLPVALHDQVRVICEEEPDRPSTAVAQTTEAPQGSEPATPEGVSRSRATDPVELRLRLAGDLDVITLKALEKAPDRRYASVDHLAEDLRRHSAGLPIEARQPTLAYRGSKFVRRHRLGVAAAGLIAASMIAGLAGTVWQARRATAQARMARIERDRARLEATKAEQVATFLIELFEISDPGASRGETVTVREVLDRGAERIETSLADQPEVQAQMMHVIGSVYSSLGLYEAAERQLGAALERRRATYGAEHLEVAHTLRQLALVRQHVGDLDGAERGYREALGPLRAAGTSDPELLQVLRDLAFVLSTRQQLDEAEIVLREALALTEDSPSVDRAGVLYGLAGLHHGKGELAEAEKLLRETIALHAAEGGRGHPDAASAMEDLALLVRFSGRLEEARRLHRDALDMRQRLYGEEHLEVADAMQHLAAVTQELSDYAAAEPLARRALELSERLRGAEHPISGLARQELARTLRSLGSYDEARRLFRATLEQHRRLYGAEHPFVLVSLIEMAECDYEARDYPAAQRRFEEALALAKGKFDEEHSMVAAAQRLLGKTLAAQGRLDEALPLLRSSLETTRKTLREDHRHNLSGQLLLAEALAAAGRRGEAEPLYRQALEGLRGSLPQGHASLAPALLGLGSLLTDSGRADEAEVLLREAQSILRRRLPAGHDRLARADAALADCLRLLGRGEAGRS